MNPAERRTDDGTDARARIDQFLDETGLAARGAKVVPLTGDASDRRYFRVLLRERAVAGAGGASRARSSSRRCRSSTSRGCSARCRCRCRASSGIPMRSASWRSRIWATSRCRRISARSPAEHAALYRQAVTFIETLQRRGRELASPDYVPYGIAFDVEKLTWELEFFVKHFLEALSRRVARGRGARGARPRSSRRSSRSWPPSRACSAIATITAAT